MESLAVIGLLVFAFVALGALFGWIVIFRLNGVFNRLYAIERRMNALEDGLRHTPKPAPPAPEPAPEPAPLAAPAPAAATAAAAPPPPPQTGERRGAFAALEASLAGNWLIWLAAVALALGGAFLVKTALDYGLLGPAARVIAAAAAGLAMIAAGEWLRRKPAKTRHKKPSAAAPALAAAGVITVYGAAYAAYGLYALVPAGAAFVLLAAVAAGAVALALLHGPVIAAFGFIGALLAPALIGSPEPNAAGLFAYVFAVCAGALAVARLMNWRWTSWIAAGGGALWPLVWLAFAFNASQAWALALFLPAYLLAAIAFAWDQAGDPPPVERPLKDWWPFPTGLVGAWFGGAAAMLLSVLLAMQAGHATETVASTAALAVIALLAAWRREGFAALPAAAAVMAALMLLNWPEDQARLVDDAARTLMFMGHASAGPSTPEFLTACFGFAALFGLGGWLAMGRLRVKAAMAIAAAGAPVMILAAAYWRLTGLETRWEWGAAAAALTGVLALGALRLVSGPKGFATAPGAASAYALAASAAAAIAVGAAFDQLWMSAGFALLAAMSAWLWARAPKGSVEALKIAAAIFGALATLRLTVLGEAFGYEVGAWPVLNWLLYGYGGSAIALWFAGRQMIIGGLKEDSRVVQGLIAGALILGVFLVSMQIRHAVNGGDLSAPYRSLTEIGLQTAAWLGAALAIRARLGPDLAFAPRWVERLLVFAAAAQGLWLLVIMGNPWWGMRELPVQGAAGFNSLLAAYAAPGLLAAAYAIVLRRQNRLRAGVAAGLAGAAKLFLWLTLEARFAFHGLEMTHRPVGDAEGWTYSAIWLGYAALLLALGVLRKRPSLRYAALGLLLAVTLKVFIIDLAGLTGLWRALSFLGLGAMLMAVGALYQRVILPMTRREASPPDGGSA